ncbi:MAG: DUF6171 family protein [Defluviitaleaceae bacterium]|nr:DUF6171 family protein [Defluviitaleaceae bacterium]
MKPCPKCLLGELDEADFARQIYAHIAALPEDERAGDVLHQERLQLCKYCDNLVNGICKLCGCFVELRAAKKGQYCPHPVSRW